MRVKSPIPVFLTFASSATETGLSEKSNRNNTPRVTKITFAVIKFLFGVIVNTFGETISAYIIGCQSLVPMASKPEKRSAAVSLIEKTIFSYMKLYASSTYVSSANGGNNPRKRRNYDDIDDMNDEEKKGKSYR